MREPTAEEIFQSTPSVGRATERADGYLFYQGISIHALRGEGDVFALSRYNHLRHFNPRPPWGGRLSLSMSLYSFFYHFNPRPPWGGRQETDMSIEFPNDFNPRPPWGGRRCIHQFVLT